MSDSTNDNPFCEQPLFSKHLCERMREINALEDDGHWYQSNEFTCGPGGDAELIGVYDHSHRGRLFYFCDPYLKRVYICKQDGEQVYAWDIPLTLEISGYRLAGATLVDVREPHWTRSICVGSEGYVYVAVFAIFQESTPASLNYLKYVTYVAQISDAGVPIQDFVMSALDARSLWDSITQRDWYSLTGAVTTYQDKLVFAHDRLATRWMAPDGEGGYTYTKVEYNSRILVKDTTSGFLISQWVTPQYDWPNNAKDLYNAVFIRANAHGVFYLNARHKTYSSPYYDYVRWWYALVGRRWDKTEICVKENESWYEEVPYWGLPKLFLFPAEHADVTPISERGFFLTDDYLILPVYLVERQQTGPHQYYYREYRYHITYTVKLEELSEEEIEQGQVPQVLVEPLAEVGIPTTKGHTYKGKAYTQDGTTIRAYSVYEATPWCGYRVDPYQIIYLLGTYPADNALSSVHAQTVSKTLYDMRDALLNLLALKDYYWPVGRTLPQHYYAIGYDVPDEASTLLSGVKAYSENDYGLKTNYQNGWRRVLVHNSYIRDIDIGEIYEAIRGLKGEFELVRVSRYSRSFLTNPDLLP